MTEKKRSIVLPHQLRRLVIHHWFCTRRGHERIDQEHSYRSFSTVLRGRSFCHPAYACLHVYVSDMAMLFCSSWLNKICSNGNSSNEVVVLTRKSVSIQGSVDRWEVMITIVFRRYFRSMDVTGSCDFSIVDSGRDRIFHQRSSEISSTLVSLKASLKWLVSIAWVYRTVAN